MDGTVVVEVEDGKEQGRKMGFGPSPSRGEWDDGLAFQIVPTGVFFLTYG